MADTTNNRLDRIEEKLDKLTDAMIAMARTEEQIKYLSEDHEKMYARINKLSTKLDDVERVVLENHRTVCFIQKLFWVALVAAAGSIAANIWI